MANEFFVKGIDHVFICTKDWKNSMNFWRDMLGLDVIDDWSSGNYHGASLQLGKSRVTLAEQEKERDDEVGFKVQHGTPYLYINVNGLDNLIESLRLKGVKILGEPTKLHWGPRMAAVQDPEGIPVMFVEWE